MIEGEIAPAVLYLTDINLDDTTALKKEYIQVKKEVNSLFKGINKDKKFVLYRALNEIPDGKKKVEHFGFIDRETE